MPPIIYQNDDGTARLEWQDETRAIWYPVSPEVFEQMVTTHNELQLILNAYYAAFDNDGSSLLDDALRSVLEARDFAVYDALNRRLKDAGPQ